MNKRLAGKTIWLTGASSGIGEACVDELSKIDCTLVLTARSKDKLEALQARHSGSKASILVETGDVCDCERMKEIAATLAAAGKAIDVLIANAGTHQATEVKDFDTKEYRRIMDINYLGALHSIEAVLPQMIARRSGYITAVSSVAGYRALPRAGAYCASKAALTTFLDSLRFDVEGYGIDVSVISPGFVKTPLTDQNDFEMPCLIEADVAARAIVQGLSQRPFEIHFPRRFSYFLKFLRILPYPVYHSVIRRFVVR